MSAMPEVHKRFSAARKDEERNTRGCCLQAKMRQKQRNIGRIMVYKEKGDETDVDEREKARYGSSVYSEEIMQKYGFMMDVCRKCISQCEAIVFSGSKFTIPKELIG